MAKPAAAIDAGLLVIARSTEAIVLRFLFGATNEEGPAMQVIKRRLIWIGLVIVIELAIGRGLQFAAERYFLTPTAEANTTPGADPLRMLEIVYREGDGSEFVFHCAPSRDSTSMGTLFTEDQAEFEKLKAAYCATTALTPDE
jgi:hypothetical protein